MTLRRRPAPLSSLARFFERQLALGEATAFCLAGGQTLFAPGDPSDQLYFLRSGRLAVRIRYNDEPERIVFIHPGEPIGEMAVIAGVRHSTDVFALRDCELLALPRDPFFRAVQADSQMLVDLSRLVLSRVRERASEEEASARRVFGLLSLSPAVKARPLMDRLGEALRRMGYRTATIGAEEGPVTAEWFANIESRNDFILYAAESEECDWRKLVARQVDAVFHVAKGGLSPTVAAMDCLAGRRLNDDLILLQDAGIQAPQGSTAWTEAVNPARLFQVRLTEAADIERLARVVAGRAVGLVLSGGAARAYAHVGAIRTLREHGVPIDLIGGVSMGAIIGAGVAMGWDDAELDRRIRKSFVSTSPVNDYTVPVVALSKGAKVRERLMENFADRSICDLWLPFFCVSTNLTTGEQQIHRDGLVREALLASLSVPGLLPPVTWGDDVLVDGAILNNFPADVMRSLHSGPIVGVDVGSGRSIEAADVVGPSSVRKWLTSGAWRGGAPIASVLIRAATVTAHHQVSEAHELTDLLIQPALDQIEIGDWKAYDGAVAAGRKAAAEALARLDRPVTDLRQPPDEEAETAEAAEAQSA